MSKQKVNMQKEPRNERNEIDARINDNLKRAFDEVAAEPLPSRFTDLLAQLRDSESKDQES